MDQAKKGPKHSGRFCQWVSTVIDVICREIVRLAKRGLIGLGTLCNSKSPKLPQIEIEEADEGNSTKADTSESAPPEKPSTDLRKITFKYRNPDAQKVELTGVFNAWQSIAMTKKGKKDVWTVTRQLLPGKYDYKFIVDNIWIKDPANPKFRTDNYGSQVSIIEVK